MCSGCYAVQNTGNNNFITQPCMHPASLSVSDSMGVQPQGAEGFWDTPIFATRKY